MLPSSYSATQAHRDHSCLIQPCTAWQRTMTSFRSLRRRTRTQSAPVAYQDVIFRCDRLWCCTRASTERRRSRLRLTIVSGFRSVRRKGAGRDAKGGGVVPQVLANTWHCRKSRYELRMAVSMDDATLPMKAILWPLKGLGRMRCDASSAHPNLDLEPKFYSLFFGFLFCY